MLALEPTTTDPASSETATSAQSQANMPVEQKETVAFKMNEDLTDQEGPVSQGMFDGWICCTCGSDNNREFTPFLKISSSKKNHR